MKLGWMMSSVLALFCFSFMSFFITFLTRKGHPTAFVLLGIGVVFILFYGYQVFVLLKYRPELRLDTVGLLLLIGIFSVVGNLLLYQAANNAPNPGLALAIGTGLQAGVVAVLALLFLKDKLSTYEIIGLILAIISVFFITLGQQVKQVASSAEPTKINQQN